MTTSVFSILIICFSFILNIAVSNGYLYSRICRPSTTVRARRTEVKRHQCPTCPRSFLRPSALVSHKRIHTEETPFYCRLPRCGRGVGARGFNVRSNCVRHEKGHIEKGELPALRPPQRGIAQPRL